MCRMSLSVTAYDTTILLLLVLAEVGAFNVDTTSPQIVTGPVDSYFGYTVKFHRNSRGLRLLVGAPKADPDGDHGIYRPGALYECDVESNGTCSSVHLDEKYNVEAGLGRFFYNESRDNQWLGVSLDNNLGGNGSVVICGHLWRNRLAQHHLVNGVCYELDGELRPGTVRKLRPLASIPLQFYSRDQYNYAFGQVGMAAHYVQDSQTLLLGAPGVYGWTGAVFSSGLSDREYWDDLHPQLDVVPANSYIGYSLGSGHFHYSPEIFYVVGAPRYTTVGKVFIFSGTFNNIWYEVEGSQVGGYFGACVCVVDVNNDGLDDMLVGEPLHQSHLYEEGRVEVFVNKGFSRFEQQALYSGAGQAGARFGSAIEPAGDINGDGYMDVVIGAPYEDEGRGAVYIHHGGQDGVSTTSVQHIRALHLDTRLRTFGTSIDSGLDVDDNGYPDVVVGSYESGQAVVLYSRPVVYLEAVMDFHKPHVDIGRYTCNYQGQPATCLQIGFIFRYTSHPSITTIDVDYELEIDTLRAEKTLWRRGLLKTDDDQLVTILTGSITLNRNRTNQTEYLAIFNQEERDLITPIQFELRYHLSASRYDDGATDLRTVPVLDAMHNTTLQKQVLYMRDCGSDNVCHADLDITARGETLDGRHYIVLGQKEVAHLLVKLTNHGEKAYLTRVDLIYPGDVRFVHVHADEPRITCLPLTTGGWDVPGDKSLLQCEIDHALREDDVIHYTIALDVSSMQVSQRLLALQLVAYTQSEEAQQLLANNVQNVSMALVVLADLDIQGGSLPEQITYKSSNTNKSSVASEYITHIYEISNVGPGLLPQLPIRVRVPSILHHGNQLISTSSVTVGKSGRSFPSDFQCEKQQRSSVQSTSGQWPAIGTDNGEEDSTSLSLNCDSIWCEEYLCVLRDFLPGSSYKMTIVMPFNLVPTLEALGRENVYIATDINITMPGMTVASPVKYITHKVDTPILPSDPRRVTAQVSGWVVVGAAGVGFTLLFIIILILQRVGFFRRKNLEELHRLIQETAENEANEQAAAPSAVASGYDPFASGESSEYQRNGNLHLLNGHPCEFSGFTVRLPAVDPRQNDVTDSLQLPSKDRKRKHRSVEDFGTMLADICAHLRSNKHRNGTNEAFCLTPEYLDVRDPNDLPSPPNEGKPQQKPRPESYLCPVTSSSNIYLPEPETPNQTEAVRASSEERLSEVGAYYLPTTEQLCNGGYESSLPRRPSPHDENCNLGDVPLQLMNTYNNNNQLSAHDQRLYPSLRVPVDTSGSIYSDEPPDMVSTGLPDNVKYSDIYRCPVPQAQ